MNFLFLRVEQHLKTEGHWRDEISEGEAVAKTRSKKTVRFNMKAEGGGGRTQEEKRGEKKEGGELARNMKLYIPQCEWGSIWKSLKEKERRGQGERGGGGYRSIC